MAVDFFSGKRPEDEEEDQAGTSLGPEQGGIVPATSSAPGSDPNAEKKTSSGSFTNLNSYLDANSGRQFGTEVAGKAQGEVDNATQKQGEVDQAFKSKVDQNTIKADDSLFSDLTSNPVGFAGDQAKKDQFTTARDAEYKGPAHLTDTEDLFNSGYSSLSKAKQVADASDSEGGRKSLLDTYYGSGVGKSGYNSGQQKLDNLLVQNDPNSRTAFKGVRDSADAAVTGWDQLNAALDSYAGQGKATTADTRKKARDTVGIDDTGNLMEGSGALGSLDQNIKTGYQTAQQKQAADRDAVQTALRNRDLTSLTPDQKAMLGDFDSTYGVDASKYVSAPQFTANQYANTDEQSQYDALSSLAGLDNTLAPDASVAGSMRDKPMVNFDQSGFQNELGTAKAGYDSSLNQLLGSTAGNVTGDTDRVNNILAQLMPEKYQWRTGGDTMITNGKPNPNGNKPLTFKNLSEAKSDLESVMNNNGYWSQPNMADSYRQQARAGVQSALDQINAQIAAQTGTYSSANQYAVKR